MYITFQQSYLLHINMTQTSFEACFDSKLKSRDCRAPQSVTVIYTNVIFYCIEQHFKQLFTVIITEELTNSSWRLYKECIVFLLHIDEFTLIAHVQKRQLESL